MSWRSFTRYTAKSDMTYLMETLKIHGVINHEPDQFPFQSPGHELKGNEQI